MDDLGEGEAGKVVNLATRRATRTAHKGSVVDPDHHGWGLVLSFDSDDPEFTRGFEAGMVWEKLGRAPGPEMLEGPYHRLNRTMLFRIAEARGYGVEVLAEDDQWDTLRFTRLPPPLKPVGG